MQALLVCAARVDGSAALVSELASAHDLVIAVDGGGELCLDAGVTPDLIIGDLDSLKTDVAAHYARKGVEVRRFPARKSRTDLDLALDAARSAHIGCVTVTAAAAGRLDHTLAVVGSLARNADLRPCIEEPSLRGWILAEGGVTTLTLAGPGSTLSILALLGSAVVSCEGTMWPLQHHRLDPMSSLGVSNVIGPHEARIEVHEGCLAVLSPRVDEVGPAGKTL